MEDQAQFEGFAAVAAPHYGGVNVPAGGTRIFARECAFSFDTQESTEGVFISLTSHQAFGKEFVGLDRERALLAGSKMPALYLRQVWRRVPKKKDSAAVEQPKVEQKEGTLVIPEENGGWELDKSDCSLVVFMSEDNPHDTDSYLSLAHPSQTRSPAAGIPERVLSAIEGIIAGADADAALAASSGPAVIEDIREVSRYSLELVQLDNGVKISPHSQDWKCSVPGCDKNTLEHGLWLNLSDGFIGCGRAQYGGAGGNGHALKHFQETGSCYPLCVKLGTITPAGGDVYSYASDEDDMVQDPYLSQHLSHFGINIMTQAKVTKSMAELSVESQQLLEFGRITEEGKELEAVTGPGFIGCDNLGNTW
jgi:ubiquitin carboxyl-terminal hydrolase 5/13